MMTREELSGILAGPFYENFADDLAARIREGDFARMLYAAATARYETLPAAVRHKIHFRGAYVLEKIFFGDRQSFMPFAAAFCESDFPACTDPSARRHLLKIMSHLLSVYEPQQPVWERIAECTAQWIVEPGAKVAVRVWAVDVLGICRNRVSWVAESWDDVLESLAQSATPGIACRLRTYRKG